jgi:DedD protein
MAKQPITDEESTLKRQARRRLIGAIALTTAVVIILPIVFDGEPPATKGGDIELRIPDKDKAIDVPLRSNPPVASAASSVVVDASAVSVATAVSSPAVTVVPAPAVKPALPQNTQEGKIEHPKPEHKAEQKTAVNHNSIPHSGFAVQVGAFANPEAAKKLQEKLTAEGLHVYTEKIGHNIRVRVGSFPTHDAADKVRHKLEAQSLHPNVVSLGG